MATTQTCYKCKVEKSLGDFNKNQKKCRSCEKLYHIERLQKKKYELVATNSDTKKQCIKCEVLLDLNKFTTGKSKCRDCVNKYERERKAMHREANPKAEVVIPSIPSIKQETPLSLEEQVKCVMRKIYRQENKEAICAQKKEYYQKNKERIKQWNEKHKEKRNARLRERRLQDRNFAAVNSMRIRISRLLQGKKDTTFDKYVGCTKVNLIKWLTHQFTEDMNWENYGYTWHIDHVVPVTFFDLDKAEDKQACFHWSNLKPLAKEQNLSKSDKIIFDYISEHQKCVKAYMCNILEYQTMYESMWWPRLELGYGKNLTDEKSSVELLRWAIRSQAATVDKRQDYAEGSTT